MTSDTAPAYPGLNLTAIQQYVRAKFLAEQGGGTEATSSALGLFKKALSGCLLVDAGVHYEQLVTPALTRHAAGDGFDHLVQLMFIRAQFPKTPEIADKEINKCFDKLCRDIIEQQNVVEEIGISGTRSDTEGCVQALMASKEAVLQAIGSVLPHKNTIAVQTGSTEAFVSGVDGQSQKQGPNGDGGFGTPSQGPHTAAVAEERSDPALGARLGAQGSNANGQDRWTAAIVAAADQQLGRSKKGPGDPR